MKLDVVDDIELFLFNLNKLSVVVNEFANVRVMLDLTQENDSCFLSVSFEIHSLGFCLQKGVGWK